MTKATALFLGFAFFAAPAFAGDSQPAPSKKEAAPEDKANSKGKAKAGEACKTNADCDQSGQGQQCTKSKCEPTPTRAAPVHPVT